MRALASNQVSALNLIDRGEKVDVETRKTIAVLEEALERSIHLRNLYRNARWQTADLQHQRLRAMLECNYQEQIRLVDVLTDRIHMLGGIRQVFASQFVQSTRFACAIRGERALGRLLGEVIDAHELILNTLKATGAETDGRWSRDFAVGQVVLANEAQSASIGDHVVTSVRMGRVRLAQADTALDEA